MICTAKSGNATLTISDNEADPNKRDTILYNIGDLHMSALAEKAMQEKNEKNKKSTA